MSSDPTATGGSQIVFCIRNDEDAAWEIAGGVKTRGFTLDRPVEDKTSSSTLGAFNESEPTGYSQGTINISGMADNRSGITDPATGFNLVGYDRISTIATSDAACAKILLVNVATGGRVEGNFNITNWGSSPETQALQPFEMTLQVRDSLVITGGGI